VLLFDNDAARKDYDVVPNDIVESTTVWSMTCRYYSGDRTRQQSVRIVCSDFRNSVGTAVSLASTETIRVFFTVTNPTINVAERYLPVFVYSVDMATQRKNNFRYIEQGIYLHNVAAEVYN